MLSSTSIISSPSQSDFDILSLNNNSFEIINRSCISRLSHKSLREAPPTTMLNDILEVKPEYKMAHALLKARQELREILTARELYDNMSNVRAENQELQMYESHVSISELDGDSRDSQIKDALDQRVAVLLNDKVQAMPFKKLNANEIADEVVDQVMDEGLTVIDVSLDEHELESFALNSAELATETHNGYTFEEGLQNYIIKTIDSIHHAHFLNNIPWNRSAEELASEAIVDDLSHKGLEGIKDPAARSNIKTFIAGCAPLYTVSETGNYFKARKSQGCNPGLARLDATQIKTAKGDIYEILSTLTDEQKRMVQLLTNTELSYSSKLVKSLQGLLAQFQQKTYTGDIQFHNTNLMRQFVKTLDQTQRKHVGSLSGKYDADKGNVNRLLQTLNTQQIEMVESLTGIPAEKNKVLVGEGAYGTVRLARNVDTGKLFVIKKMLDREAAEHEIKSNNEIGEGAHFVTAVDHAHVTTVGSDKPSEDKSYLIFPYYDDGDGAHMIYNLQVLKGQDPDAAAMKEKLIAYTLICAGEALHRQNIIHRDIKPENLLFSTEMGIGLSDFGLAEKESRKYDRDAGTPGYLPPEFGTKNYAGKAHDAWSAGMTMLEFKLGQYIDQNKNFSLNINNRDIPLKFTGEYLRCDGIDKKALNGYKLRYNTDNEIIAGFIDTNKATRLDFQKAKESPYFAEFNNA